MAVSLAGCVGISPLPVQETAYLRYQIETALDNDHCIKELFLLNQNGKRIAIITLVSASGNEESDCLKAVRTLSRDPKVPAVDSVNIKAVCPAGTRPTMMTVSREVPIVNGRGVTTMTDISVPVNIGSEEVTKTVFSCVITRDALMEGKDPEVVIRDGIFVSGPNAGKAVTF